MGLWISKPIRAGVHGLQPSPLSNSSTMCSCRLCSTICTWLRGSSNRNARDTTGMRNQTCPLIIWWRFVKSSLSKSRTSLVFQTGTWNASTTKRRYWDRMKKKLDWKRRGNLIRNTQKWRRTVRSSCPWSWKIMKNGSKRVRKCQIQREPTMTR